MVTVGLWFTGAVLLYVFIFFTGFRLAHKGKPYAIAVSTAHKLLALAALALLIVALVVAGQQGPLGRRVWAGALLTGLLFVVTIVAGGVLSLDRPQSVLAKALHRSLPYLVVLTSTVAFVLLLVRG